MSAEKHRGLLKSILKMSAVAALLAIAYFFIFSLFFDNDEQSRLKSDNEVIEQEYLELVERRDLVDTVIDDLFRRDRMIYRNLFSADPFSMSNLDSSSFLLSFSDTSGNPSRMLDISSASSLIDRRFLSLMEKMDSSSLEGRRIPSIAPVRHFQPSNASASVGDKMNPFFKKFQYHSGLDIVAAEFTDVLATADGVVTTVKRAYHDEGNLIEIDHGDYVTKYSHLGDILVRKGQRVSRGKMIARVGSTGVSFAPHLHYEIRFKGEIVDPVYYMFQGLTPREFVETIISSANSMQSFD